jgi:1-acyl-sn-glycerol-3-phosphate acyltransferase
MKPSSFLYHLSRLIGGLLLKFTSRIHLIGDFKSIPKGRCVLACNHVSHFDPHYLSNAFSHRHIHFLAMKELFSKPLAHWFFTKVGCVCTDRTKAHVSTIRTAIRFLNENKTLGVYPEGGLKANQDSVLNGGPTFRGAAVFAHLTRSPLQTCIIVGSDQLYRWQNIFKRPDVYLVLGPVLKADYSLPRKASRFLLQQQMEQSFRARFEWLKNEWDLAPNLFPKTAQERWAEKS